MPTAANAGYYAQIVRERAILRRLVEAGTRIVQIGYAGDGDVDELVDRAQAEIYGVTERRVTEDYCRCRTSCPARWTRSRRSASRGGVMTGVPTGFADLDALTNGLHAGPDDRHRGPAGDREVDAGSRSVLGRRRSSTGMATVIFSLEMSRNEITMRLLSAEARVPLHQCAPAR